MKSGFCSVALGTLDAPAPLPHFALMSLEHVFNTPLTVDDVADGGIKGSCCPRAHKMAR